MSGGRPPGARGPDIMWSPWRMAYVSAEKEHGFEGPRCVFCNLPLQDDDARTYILYRGARAFVIMNLYPYNNGHLMVVPYAHVDSLLALDDETVGEMTGLLRRSQAVLEERMAPQGFNVGINQGRAAGAGIADHLHIHLLPRWVGDTNFMPTLGDTRVMPQHLDETYALLAGGFAA
ncbi:MAG: HIT domain-containing protein [Thermoleophilia bacterium]